MTQISISDLKVNPGKYVSMAQEQDIMITCNGKIVAKIVNARPDKKTAWANIVNIMRTPGMDVSDEDLERDREERILG